jgi:hypothetical protein
MSDSIASRIDPNWYAEKRSKDFPIVMSGAEVQAEITGMQMKLMNVIEMELRRALEGFGLTIGPDTKPETLKRLMKLAGIQIVHFVHEGPNDPLKPEDNDGWYFYKRDNHEKMQIALILSEPTIEKDGRIKVERRYTT